jgi:hypothetical protein
MGFRHRVSQRPVQPASRTASSLDRSASRRRVPRSPRRRGTRRRRPTGRRLRFRRLRTIRRSRPSRTGDRRSVASRNPGTGPSTRRTLSPWRTSHKLRRTHPSRRPCPRTAADRGPRTACGRCCRAREDRSTPIRRASGRRPLRLRSLGSPRPRWAQRREDRRPRCRLSRSILPGATARGPHGGFDRPRETSRNESAAPGQGPIRSMWGLSEMDRGSCLTPA